mmetsp:Transcript_2831/g.3735  ORF Transcript_2831/g.3735 Transcript_2831/m.3735 type:complete len:84 (+) Transcript_2831:215-466(+)
MKRGLTHVCRSPIPHCGEESNKQKRGGREWKHGETWEKQQPEQEQKLTQPQRATTRRKVCEWPAKHLVFSFSNNEPLPTTKEG